MTESNLDAQRLVALLSGRAVAGETYNEADWQRIVDLAQRQSVAPMLYVQLKERGITPSPDAAQQLHHNYHANAARNTWLFHEVGNICRALLTADIPVIPLKGVYLAEAVYGNIALREIGDVDLLVKPVNLVKALGVLRTLGYATAYPFEIESVRQESQHMPPLSKRGGVSIELHWTIVNPRINSRFEDDDLDQVWSRATPIKIDGVQVLMLSPADLLWHLCLHVSVQHRFDAAGLRNYLDIALVIQQSGDAIDWTQFTAQVNQWGIANGVRLALQLTQEWTGISAPSPVMAALNAAPLDDATMDWVQHKILNGTSPAVKSNVARLGKERMTDRLVVLRDALFPSRNAMASMYHAPATSWRILFYYPVRFKYLWTRYNQAVWQLLWRDKTLTTEARQEARLREYLGWN